MSHIRCTTLLCLFATAAPALAQVGGNYSIDWHTIDGGGQTLQIGVSQEHIEYVVGSSVGQIDAVGPVCADPYILIGGFWAAALPCPVDFDSDGFLTGTDFDLYIVSFEEGGRAADFDCDGFVTGLDFDYFIQAFERGCGK